MLLHIDLGSYAINLTCCFTVGNDLITLFIFDDEVCDIILYGASHQTLIFYIGVGHFNNAYSTADAFTIHQDIYKGLFLHLL